nr:hypothetical protein [Haloglycomyces albus]
MLLSEEDYEAWQETMFLLRSRKNAERLMQSIQEADRGNSPAERACDAANSYEGNRKPGSVL